MNLRRSALAALLAASVISPASAGMFDDEEARARIDAVKRETAARFERMETAQRQQIELANQIELVRQDIAKLRGQVEVLTYELESAQKRQKDFYVDLDDRLRKLEVAAQEQHAKAAAVSPAANNSAARVDPVEESRDYEAALTLLKGGKYRDAGNAFEGFVGKYPDSQFQASANYWAGSAFYQGRDYAKANNYFGKVASNWPNDSRAPDAMLGLANAQADGGDAKAAKATLQSLASKYPSSNAAQVAKQRLAKK
jgi:tol-pal system protein YbgF